MIKFKQHLIDKGYKVIGNKAVLQGTEFKICIGRINTARGKRMSYWLELI